MLALCNVTRDRLVVKAEVQTSLSAASAPMTLKHAPACDMKTGKTRRVDSYFSYISIGPLPNWKRLPTTRGKIILAQRGRSVSPQLFKGVRAMQESVTYQAILDEGRVEALQKTILRQGRKLFGAADEGTTAAVTAIDDVQRLEFLSDRLLDVKSWRDLLAQ
jgi:hypothetical protein